MVTRRLLLIEDDAQVRSALALVLSDEGWELQFRLGAWVGNQRSRAATLSEGRREQLSAIGMRWA